MRGIVETKICIDANELNQKLKLDPTSHFAQYLTLFKYDQPYDRALFHVHDDIPEEPFIEICYKDAQYRVGFRKRSVTKGGWRTYFVCKECGEQSIKLYFSGDNFLCRKCLNLGHKTQYQDYYDRILTKSGKLNKKLGGKVNGQMLKKEKEKLTSSMVKISTVGDGTKTNGCLKF